ncbi:MAG TPA: carbohydrate ABC transporter permease, partial [Blastocatellia bacterium]|nr:carbohydrate ABC transporter permease [Blastocatellia bacterium]
MKPSERAVRLGKYLLLFGAVLLTILPLYWMLTISLKSDADTFAVPPLWFRFGPTGRHYHEIFVEKSFG